MTRNIDFDSGLEPPDYNQCQAFPNMLNYSPFSLGPKPDPIRCKNAPVRLAVEIEPGKDGKCGSMTVCQSCAELMMDIHGMRRRIKLLPLEGEDAS